MAASMLFQADHCPDHAGALQLACSSTRASHLDAPKCDQSHARARSLVCTCYSYQYLGAGSVSELRACLQKDKHSDLSMLLGGGGGMKLPPLPYLAGEMADYDMVPPSPVLMRDHTQLQSDLNTGHSAGSNRWSCHDKLAAIH